MVAVGVFLERVRRRVGRRTEAAPLTRRAVTGFLQGGPLVLDHLQQGVQPLLGVFVAQLVGLAQSVKLFLDLFLLLVV